MEEFAALMMLGVRVRNVEELQDGAIWMEDQRILFIDSALTHRERADLAQMLLPDALAS